MFFRKVAEEVAPCSLLFSGNRSDWRPHGQPRIFLTRLSSWLLQHTTPDSRWDSPADFCSIPLQTHGETLQLTSATYHSRLRVRLSSWLLDSWSIPLRIHGETLQLTPGAYFSRLTVRLLSWFRQKTTPDLRRDISADSCSIQLQIHGEILQVILPTAYRSRLTVRLSS